MLDALRRHLDPGRIETVLDVGCGSASLSCELAATYPNLVVSGMDPASQFQEFINPPANFSFVAGSLERIPPQVAESRYDLMICGEVLEHIEDDAAALQRMWELLSPNGQLLLSVPHRRDYWGPEDEWAGHQRRYERDELRRKLEAAGFSIVEMMTWGHPVVRLYDLHVFPRLIEREGVLEKQGVIRRVAMNVLYLLFRFDRMFLGSRRGIGLIGLARKD